MEGNVALRVVAALLAFGGAAVLGSAVARRLAKRSRSAAYSIGGEKNRAGWVSWLVRNGVGLMRPVARAVLRNARVRASVTNLLTAVEGIGFIATEESLLSLVLAAMLVVGVGGSCAHCGSDMRRGPRLGAWPQRAQFTRRARKTSGASVCERPFPTRCARWRCAFGRGSRFSRRCSRLGLLRKVLLGYCSSAQLTFSRRAAAHARHSRFSKGGTRSPSSPSFPLRLTCSIKRGEAWSACSTPRGDHRR